MKIKIFASMLHRIVLFLEKLRIEIWPFFVLETMTIFLSLSLCLLYSFSLSFSLVPKSQVRYLQRNLRATKWTNAVAFNFLTWDTNCIKWDLVLWSLIVKAQEKKKSYDYFKSHRDIFIISRWVENRKGKLLFQLFLKKKKFFCRLKIVFSLKIIFSAKKKNCS